MINYYYIYYNKKTNDIISHELHESIWGLIINYHYPCCLSEFVEITPKEEDRIMNDEFGLMKELIGKLDNDIEIIQVPRLIYDLFHSYSLIRQLKAGVKPTINYFGFDYISVNPTNSQYYNYSKKALEMQMNKMNMILLKFINDFAFNFIKDKLKSMQNITFIQWEFIMKSLTTYLVGEYSKIRENIVEDYKNISKIIEEYLYFNKINLVELVGSLDRNTNQLLNDFYLYLENKTRPNDKIYIEMFLRMVIFYIKKKIIKDDSVYYTEYLKVLFNDDNIKAQLLNNVNPNITELLPHRIKILIDNENQYLLKYKNYKLLKQVLLDEIGVHIYKKNINKYCIMYRGLLDDEDSVIDRKSSKTYPQSYSLSFNSSILNGHWTDETACTYFYMVRNDNTLKYRYLYEKKINKYNRAIKFSDGYPKECLFFIPPLHPMLQLSSSGEFWHIRTLVGEDSSIININKFASIFHDGDNLMYFPTFLRSSLDTYTLETLYNEFIDGSNNYFYLNKVDITKYVENERELFNKYLLYKKKYLALKNKAL